MFENNLALLRKLFGPLVSQAIYGPVENQRLYMVASLHSKFVYLVV